MEKQAQPLTAGDRLQLPQLQSRPILDKVRDYLLEIHAEILPKSPEGRAVRYTLKNWTALARYSEDGDLEIDDIPDGVPRVILATGSHIGEGFDDSSLDTLFLTMPISWRGTLQQYVGRLHRIHDGKKVVRVYDYVDAHVPMLARMYEKRLKGYRAIGYELEGEPDNDLGV